MCRYPSSLEKPQAICAVLRGTAVERQSLAGELSLSCARPVADRWPFMWLNRPLYVNQPGQLSMFDKLGEIASEVVIIQVIKSKCIPAFSLVMVLQYAL